MSEVGCIETYCLEVFAAVIGCPWLNGVAPSAVPVQAMFPRIPPSRLQPAVGTVLEKSWQATRGMTSIEKLRGGKGGKQVEKGLVEGW